MEVVLGFKGTGHLENALYLVVAFIKVDSALNSFIFMKKSILLSIFLLSFGQLFSQNENSVSWGLSVAPHVTDLLGANSDGFEKPYPLGLGLRFEVSSELFKRLYFRTGLAMRYSNVDYRDYSPVFATDFNVGSASPDRKKSYFKSTYSMFLIDIPIGFAFQLSKKPSKWYTRAELHTFLQLHQSQTNVLISPGGPLTYSRNIVDAPFVQFAGSLGFGYQFKALRNRTFFVEPTALVGLSDSFEGEEISRGIIDLRLWIVDLKIGTWF